MSNPFDLNGKTALVTGAGGGIGAACAKALAQAGANVMITDIDEGLARNSAQACKTEGLNVNSCVLDATRQEDWDTAVTATLAAFGGWHILINNAGIYIGGLVVQNSLEEVQRLNRINIESVFLGMKAAAEVMKPGGRSGEGGSIVNLSSVAGLIGVPGHSAYGSTKGSVRGYSRHAAVEFGILEYGIRVNSLHPGLIETPMGDQAFQDFVDIGLAANIEEAKTLVLGMTPCRRFGNVSDIANAAVFLASDASSFMTGSELVVDGGMSAA